MSTNHRNNDKHTCASKFINTNMVQNVQALCGTQLGQVLGIQNKVKISKMSINHTNYDEYTCSSKYVYINMTDHTTHARPSCNKWVVGAFDICAKQNISFMNETNRNEMWPRLKGWVQKIIQTLQPNLAFQSYNFFLNVQPYFLTVFWKTLTVWWKT